MNLMDNVLIFVQKKLLMILIANAMTLVLKKQVFYLINLVYINALKKLNLTLKMNVLKTVVFIVR